MPFVGAYELSDYAGLRLYEFLLRLGVSRDEDSYPSGCSPKFPLVFSLLLLPEGSLRKGSPKPKGDNLKVQPLEPSTLNPKP